MGEKRNLKEPELIRRDYEEDHVKEWRWREAQRFNFRRKRKNATRDSLFEHRYGGRTVNRGKMESPLGNFSGK